MISPDLFEVLDIPMIRGRSFTRADHDEAPPVVVVNEALARQQFPDAVLIPVRCIHYCIVPNHRSLSVSLRL